MKVFSLLLSDFNFLWAESVPSPFLLHGQILLHARASRLVFTLPRLRGGAIFWDGSRMLIPNRLD